MCSSAFGQRLIKVPPEHSLLPLNQQTLNPVFGFTALSGYHGATQLNLNLRSVWSGIPNSNSIHNISADHYLSSINSGLGVSINRVTEFKSIITHEDVSINLSPRFELGPKTHLLTAVNISLSQSTVHLDRLPFCEVPCFTFSKQFGAVWPQEFREVWLNAGLGLGLIYSNTMLLIQSHYLSGFEAIVKTLPDEPTKIPRPLSVYSSHRFNLGQNWNLTPSVSYFMQAEARYSKLALNARYKNVSFGAGYAMTNYNFGYTASDSWFSQLLFQFGLSISQRVVISYSYDVNTSSIGTQSLGSHELGIRTTLFKDKAKNVLIKDLQIL